MLDDLIDPSAEFKQEIAETLYRSSAEYSSIDTILGEEERLDDGFSMLTAEDYFQFRL